jgi:hypothetical protein
MAHNFAASMLSLVHGTGKLMGLAPYRDPLFFNALFVGNETGILERFGGNLWTKWSAHCQG